MRSTKEELIKAITAKPMIPSEMFEGNDIKEPKGELFGFDPINNCLNGINFSWILVTCKELDNAKKNQRITNGKYTLIYRGVAYGGPTVGIVDGEIHDRGPMVHSLDWVNNNCDMYIPEEDLIKPNWRIDE